MIFIEVVTSQTYIIPPNAIHYDDVIMGTMAFQITSLTIVYSTVYSGEDQSKHQSSASLAFVWGINRGPVNSPYKWSVTRKMFPFDDVIMVVTNPLITLWEQKFADLHIHFQHRLFTRRNVMSIFLIWLLRYKAHSMVTASGWLLCGGNRDYNDNAGWAWDFKNASISHPTT